MLKFRLKRKNEALSGSGPGNDHHSAGEASPQRTVLASAVPSSLQKLSKAGAVSSKAPAQLNACKGLGQIQCKVQGANQTKGAPGPFRRSALRRGSPAFIVLHVCGLG